MKLFNKVLIANRGEIAVRILRTLKSLGIGSVVVYSQEDQDALFVRLAGEKHLLRGDGMADTYLNIDKIMQVAQLSGCDAIHPGYGFLAENPELPAACERLGIVFIGPQARVMQLMGDKLQASMHVASLGFPVIPRVLLPDENKAPSLEESSFPIMVKAVAGGGGKAMRLVKSAQELQRAMEEVKREALAYFGDDRIYLERYLEPVRHIEVQVLGDGKGQAVHLYDRECTIQRRNQKIIEEAPSSSLGQEQRDYLCQMAVDIARSVNYLGAGTIEFLMHGQDFYFLEMNTRIQVEHPVTEEITARDLIADQLFIARNNGLPFRQDEISISGHAIQVRIYAEDPENDFRPTPGNIQLYRQAMGKGIRVDASLDGPTMISDRFDPMVTKLIVHTATRTMSIQKMKQALSEFRLLGIRTNLEFLWAVMVHEPYIQNKLNTCYCMDFTPELLQTIHRRRKQIPDVVTFGVYTLAMMHAKPLPGERNATNSIAWKLGYWRQQPFFNLIREATSYKVLSNYLGETLNITIGNDVYAFKNIDVAPGRVLFTFGDKDYVADYSSETPAKVFGNIEGKTFEINNALYTFERPRVQVSQEAGSNGASETIMAPMHGKVIFVGFQELQHVKKGDVLMIIEAMKMENNILAPRDALVKRVHALTGSQVEKNMPLIILQ